MNILAQLIIYFKISFYLWTTIRGENLPTAVLHKEYVFQYLCISVYYIAPGLPVCNNAYLQQPL